MMSRKEKNSYKVIFKKNLVGYNKVNPKRINRHKSKEGKKKIGDNFLLLNFSLIFEGKWHMQLKIFIYLFHL